MLHTTQSSVYVLVQVAEDYQCGALKFAIEKEAPMVLRIFRMLDKQLITTFDLN